MNDTPNELPPRGTGQADPPPADALPAAQPLPEAPEELEMEVFRAGDYGAKGSYGAADLDAIAAGYDPAFYEAPVTLDHAQDGPASGWVASVRRVGDKLVARLKGLAPELRRAIASGAYKKPSVELYLPGSGGRTLPALKAVSLLGARVPEVKGLAAPAFSEGSPEMPEGVVALDSPRPEGAPAFGSGPAKPVRPPANVEAMLERLRRKGKYLPAWDRAGLPDFLGKLAALEAEASGAAAFSFGETEGGSAVEWLGGFLESMGSVCFGSVADPPPSQASSGLRFRLPREDGRTVVSPGSVQLHQAAARFLADDPTLNYSEALRRASGERSPARF